MDTGLNIIFLFIALLTGSFLNVVIWRGPVIWGLAGDKETMPPGLSLAGPRSFCPACREPLRAWHLVPVISYIVLRGRCASCGTKIPLRYPLTELAVFTFAALILWKFGLSWSTFGYFVFFCFSLALAQIDARTGFLPDALTLPLLISGLIASVSSLYTGMLHAIGGAATGYLALWGIAAGYKLLRDREGLGLGDAKYLAAAGAWLGWFALPFIVLTAACAGLVYAVWRSGRGDKIEAGTEIPFGPFLAGGAVTVFWIALSRPGFLP